MSDVLKKLQAANPDLNIMDISDPALTPYGRLLNQYDASEMIERALAILPTTERVAYVASVTALEEPCTFNRAMAREVFGGMPMEVGWCYGSNLGMGGLEYHKGIEVDVCLTDCIFLFGNAQDIVFGDEISYDAAKVVAFYAPKGSVVEFHCWNLHFAPQHVYEGGSFATLVYLPKGTNEKLPFAVEKVGEARLLTNVNKWLMTFPDTGMAKHGVYPAMVGNDITIKPV